MNKRCTLCGHKLNDNNECETKDCPNYIRAKISKAIENKKKNNTSEV